MPRAKQRRPSLRQIVRELLYPPVKARRYLPAQLEFEEFFETLKRDGLNYAVLRWFEELPHVEAGEDIDLLVADEDLDALGRYLRPTDPFGTRPAVDIYTPSGLPGSDYRGLPYFPTPFAERLLERAVLLRGTYRVPCDEDHFDSMAYHAVYHKGYASGLSPGGPAALDHPYPDVLRQLARDLGVQVELELSALDAYLAGRGLRPPMDTLERLQYRNPWIRDAFFVHREPIESRWDGLAVFVLREAAFDQLPAVRSELDRAGFEILDAFRLDDAASELLANEMRGGNWGRGPWPASGGKPRAYVVAYDFAPRFGELPTGETCNLRIPEAKEAVRVLIQAGYDPARRFNPMHSSDSPRQALDYLQLLGRPGIEERYHTRIGMLERTLAFPYPVIRLLGGRRRRSLVALVEHSDLGPCVCKLFRPGAIRFFERELRARSDFGTHPEVPELLEHGENWILLRYYEDNRSHIVRRLPGGIRVQLRLDASRQLARLVASLHERGAFLLDLSTNNVITDPVAGLKLLDFEFLQDYQGEPPPLSLSYTLRSGPYPDGVDTPLGAHDVFALRTTGVPFSLLLSDRRFVQQVVRVSLQSTFFVLAGLSSLRRRAAHQVHARKAVDLSRHALRLIGVIAQVVHRSVMRR